MNLKLYSIFTTLFTTLFLISTIAFGQPPENNTAAGAISLTPSATCTPSATFYTTQEATQSVINAAYGAGGVDDVWFKFVASTTGIRISLQEVTSTGASTWQGRVELWSDAPSEGASYYKPDNVNTNDLFLAAIAGNNAVFNYSYLTNALSPGATYYVRVYGSNSSVRGNFKICAENLVLPVIPPNNACWNAQTLTLSSGASCTNSVNGTTLNASSGTSNLAFCHVSALSAKDVWYKFVATSNNISIALSNVALSEGTSSNLAMQLSSVNPDASNGLCNGSQLACGDDLAPLSYTALTSGETYYIRVFNKDVNSASSFTLCANVPAPPINDDCAAALTLPINTSPVATAFLAGTTNAATSSVTSNTCAGTIANDVWFKFTPTASQLVNGVLSVKSHQNFNYALYTGNCGTLSQVAGWCGNSTNPDLPALTAGVTYYLRAYGLGAVSYDISLIKMPVALTNDNCAGAIDISSTASTGYVSAHTREATVTAGAPDCFDFEQPYAKDVWFKTTVTTAGNYVIDIKNLISRYELPVPVADVQVQVLKNCGGSVILCRSSYKNQALPIIEKLDNAPTEYYIRIIETPNSPGWFNFDIAFRLTNTPTNDEFAGAINLVQDLTCNTVSGTFFNATISTNPAEDISIFPKMDVWYKFIAVSTNPKIELKNTSANVKMAVYEGTPTGTAGINGTSTINAAGLTIGQTYYIRVYKTDNNPEGAHQGNFEICVSGYPSVAIADNVAACETTDQTLVSNGSNSWLHFTKSGKLVLSVFDGPANSGQTFAPRGNITASFYTNTGAVRTDASSKPYLDRNFEISAQNNNLNNNVRFRLYLSETELNNLIGAAGSEVGNIHDLKIARFANASCNISVGASSVNYNIVAAGKVASDIYYIEGITPDFSGFFLMNVPAVDVLPVTCDVFTANTTKEGIALNWKTKSEVNSKAYQLYRSSNGVDFSLVKTMNSDNKINGSSYTHTDKVKPGITYYYRLKQTDLDGTVQNVCDDVSAIWNGLNEPNLLVYPNPAKNKIRVNLPTNAKLFKIQIFSATGSLVYNKQHQNSETEIDIAKLNNGFYTIRITANDGTWSSKFVKSN